MTFSLEHGICCIFPSELFCPLSDGYSVSKKLVFSLLLTQLACSEGALIFDCMKIFFFPRDDLGRTVSFQGKHQPLYKHVTRSDRSSWQIWKKTWRVRHKLFYYSSILHRNVQTGAGSSCRNNGGSSSENPCGQWLLGFLLTVVWVIFLSISSVSKPEWHWVTE